MKAFIIAEIGQAHDGSLGILHSYIDAIANTGVDAIKFQTHIANAESSEQEPFRVNFSYEDKTRFDYWKRMEFSLQQWLEIKAHCDEVRLEFISSPFSVLAVEWLEQLGVKKYKVGSGEVINLLMLDAIAKTGKDIILSSGMSSFQELDETISFLLPYGNNLSVLQCTTQYPTPPENIGLNVISELKQRYSIPVGLSDHSGSIFPSIAAVQAGAEVLEFHTVFDRAMFGPDAQSSLTISEVKKLVEGVRLIEKANLNPVDKSSNEQYTKQKAIFEKSLAVNKALKAGHVLTLEDLEAKKPSGCGIPARDYKSVLGKSIKRDLEQWGFLNEVDLNE